MGSITINRNVFVDFYYEKRVGGFKNVISQQPEWSKNYEVEANENFQSLEKIKGVVTLTV